MHGYCPSGWKAEGEGLIQFQGQPGLHSKTCLEERRRSMGVHSYNHSSWEAEAEGSGIKGQLLSFGKDIFNIYHEFQFMAGHMFSNLTFPFSFMLFLISRRCKIFFSNKIF